MIEGSRAADSRHRAEFRKRGPSAASLPHLRLATPADFKRYAGRDPDPDWHVHWRGYVVERDGELIGMMVASLDRYGRIWAWTDTREPMPAILLHRSVKIMLDSLRKAGAAEIYCYRNDALPTSERWLRRLGFLPDAALSEGYPETVWSRRLDG